ncbi:MAG: hypothetical protein ACOC5R_03265 [Elusimicrobiota bacterium]
MKSVKTIFLVFLLPVFLILSVSSASSSAKFETGVELGYLDSTNMFSYAGPEPTETLKYDIDVKAPPFSFIPNITNYLDVVVEINIIGISGIYPKAFLKYNLTDSFNIGINMGYVQDAYEIIAYDDHSDSASSLEIDEDGSANDSAEITCYSTSTTKQSISMLPIMAEMNISILKKENLNILAGLSYGIAMVHEK